MARVSMVRRLGFVVLPLVLVVAGACGGDDDDAAASDTDSDSSGGDESEAATDESTTTTLTEDEAEVVSAVQASFAALDAAYDPPNPDHPDLAATYSGDPLNGLRQDILLYQGRGESQIGDLLDESHEVLTVVGDSATVRSCTREQWQDVDTATREPKGNQQEEVVHADQHLERIDGMWKITSIEFLAEPCSFD